MATIRPFAALRPADGMAEKIAALPYDVYNRKEAKEAVKDAPHSFLRKTVRRPLCRMTWIPMMNGCTKERRSFLPNRWRRANI